MQELTVETRLSISRAEDPVLEAGEQGWTPRQVFCTLMVRLPFATLFHLPGDNMPSTQTETNNSAGEMQGENTTPNETENRDDVLMI